jgi:hypothetical protein
MILAGVALIFLRRPITAFFLARLYGLEEDKYDLSTAAVVGGIVLVVGGVLSLIGGF